MKTYFELQSNNTVPAIFLQSSFQRKRPKAKNLVICKMSQIIEKMIQNSQCIPQYSLQNNKIMPFDFEESSPHDNHNSSLKDIIYTQNNLVSTKEFLYKLQQNLKCPDEFFIGAFLLISKYLNVCPLQITEQNCQRLIACAVLLLEKQFNDFEISQFTYSRAMNIPMRDLKLMELDFLETIGWETNIEANEFESFKDYFNSLQV